VLDRSLCPLHLLNPFLVVPSLKPAESLLALLDISIDVQLLFVIELVSKVVSYVITGRIVQLDLDSVVILRC
jgi:hypothetical protein